MFLFRTCREGGAVIYSRKIICYGADKIARLFGRYSIKVTRTPITLHTRRNLVNGCGLATLFVCHLAAEQEVLYLNPFMSCYVDFENLNVNLPLEKVKGMTLVSTSYRE